MAAGLLRGQPGGGQGQNLGSRPRLHPGSIPPLKPWAWRALMHRTIIPGRGSFLPAAPEAR
jgi:hypothetical protein